MAIWDDVIPESERKAYEKAGWGGRIGFGKRPALLIVDMNKAFVEPDYPFSSPTAIPTAKAIREVLHAAREARIPILYTTLAPIRHRAELGYWKADALTGPVMTEGDGREIHPLIAPREGEPVLEKFYPSGFFGTSLLSQLTFHQVDTILLTGTVTSGCVRATALDAFNYNFRVIIPETCVCDRGEVSHKVALFELHMKYADVVPTEEVLAYLKEIRAD